MNSDRYYELKLLALEPYWRELLAAWLGSILILAIIRSVLFWMGKSKPGEFAKFLGLVPTLTVMVLPGLAGLLMAFRVDKEAGAVTAIAAFLIVPLLAIFLASKLKSLLVWIFTGMGRSRLAEGGSSATDNAFTAEGRPRPLLNGKPLD